MRQTEAAALGRTLITPTPDAPAFDRGAAARDLTLSSHREAVERVIAAARERLSESLSLRDMSRIAYISPFHFNRVFHQITGLPPGKFVGALRLETAKRLLLTTTRSVTDICYEVGYNSLGTFTTRFTQLVGVGPRELRRLAERFNPASVGALCGRYDELTAAAPGPASVTGFVASAVRHEGPVFVGLFPANVPQKLPAGGTLLRGPGAFRVGRVPDGTYYLLAAALPESGDTLSYLLPGTAGLLVGVGDAPVVVRRDAPAPHVPLSLRPAQLTDPPLLISLPFLLTNAPAA
ncbi:MAG TPA: helix-turn-helix transcriptional regulator [Pyrinomonadaceae bacterium]|nr:helix-turn-helix transcriptional regulator [Pyrinomonadaceae bacterium]